MAWRGLLEAGSSLLPPRPTAPLPASYSHPARAGDPAGGLGARPVQSVGTCGYLLASHRQPESPLGSWVRSTPRGPSTPPSFS